MTAVWIDDEPAELDDQPVAALPGEFIVDTRDRSWMIHGSCRGQPQGAWFPERGESIEIATSICSTCPVREACLDYGMDERFGIWGGVSERERRRMRSRRLPARNCARCRAVFTPRVWREKYCSSACSEAQHREQKYENRKQHLGGPQ